MLNMSLTYERDQANEPAQKVFVLDEWKRHELEEIDERLKSYESQAARKIKPNYKGGHGMTNVLFVCSGNRDRSPTAEQVFRDIPGWDVKSAGTWPDAENQVTKRARAF